MRESRTGKLLKLCSALVVALFALQLSSAAHAQQSSQPDVQALAADELRTAPTPTPGNVVDANASGQRVALGLRPDGRFFVRRNLGSGWSKYYPLGAGAVWNSGDVAIRANGDITVAAVKKNGEVWTRSLTAAGEWGPFNWAGWGDPGIAPSIAANDTDLVLATISNLGELQTKRFASKWGRPTSHGPRWLAVDIDVAEDGDIWFAGTKTSGEVLIRKNLGKSWSGFKELGRPTWSLETSPSISASSTGVIFAGVKANGQLYTLRQVAGKWQTWTRHGVGSWANADVAMSENGSAWLVGTKDTGRLFTRESVTPKNWNAWAKHGLDTWATTAKPSVTIDGKGRMTYLAVKADGMLFARSRTGAKWSGFLKMTNQPWETGANPSALEPPEWLPGAEITLERVSLYDFHISWTPTFEIPEVWELTLTKDEVSKTHVIDESDLTAERFYRVWKFDGGAPQAGDIFDLELVAVNSAGKSDALTYTVAMPKPIFTNPDEKIGSGVTETAALSLGANGTGDECWNVWAGPEGSEFGALYPTEILVPFPFLMAVSKPWGVRYMYLELGSYAVATKVCVNDGVIVVNEPARPGCEAAGRIDHVVTEKTAQRLGTLNRSHIKNEFDCTICPRRAIKEVMDVCVTMTIEQHLVVEDGELVGGIPDGDSWVAHKRKLSKTA